MYMALEVALDVLSIRTNHVTYVIGELCTCFLKIFMQYCFVIISLTGIVLPAGLCFPMLLTFLIPPLSFDNGWMDRTMGCCVNR